MVSIVSATPSPSPGQARPDQTMPDPVGSTTILLGTTRKTPFVYDRLCLIISRHGLWGPSESPDYILTLMQTLEGLRDTLSSTGINKLNLDKLILSNPKEGVEFTPDALASFSIELHSSEENEQYAKLYRVFPLLPSPSRFLGNLVFPQPPEGAPFTPESVP
ncbi:hypothetical protein M422DRAFT_262153 [Sphaerobolus stellatus SS14]|uniref:Unplaced genomic scaffold SPHSTscaffold_112, whole genome shotgun sequence n=1 Tax=Sphaerobolus stellatus (strain SS14) TaxID=990650 RepID=A0A0C9VDS4_SPHS4|nr:hypothetical protein M422DRAFT_262153 [Sphaerobolus stellatus SS14]